ncbi:hypothetical protein BpHYR1_039998 [Brachionus plicatilis]|uniref:Uncharacterized protein n=1 Tax=Brachionus plicatilis TaxID=10195 RepID=A0A3M7SJ19_BRAPC|nr:hypothetical protein BpHYR1_039998 [Brachionus plicatilis]
MSFHHFSILPSRKLSFFQILYKYIFWSFDMFEIRHNNQCWIFTKFFKIFNWHFYLYISSRLKQIY